MKTNKGIVIVHIKDLKTTKGIVIVGLHSEGIQWQKLEEINYLSPTAGAPFSLNICFANFAIAERTISMEMPWKASDWIYESILARKANIPHKSRYSHIHINFPTPLCVCLLQFVPNWFPNTWNLLVFKSLPNFIVSANSFCPAGVRRLKRSYRQWYALWEYPVWEPFLAKKLARKWEPLNGTLLSCGHWF